MLKFSWLIATLGLLLSGSIGRAANARFTVDVFGTLEGLPSRAVLALTQTRDGYLWAGTPHGLARFDGLEFRVFDPNNTPGLRSGEILSLYGDRQGNLWVGTGNAGVTLVHSGKVSALEVGRITGIGEDANGSVWFYNDSGKLFRYRDKQVDEWNANVGHATIFRGLVADENGILWVGTDTNLAALGPIPPPGGTAKANLRVIPQSTRLERLDLVLASKFGGYWRLGDFRIERWKEGRLISDWPYPSATGVPVAACEDLSGNLVVGTFGDGVYWFDAKGTPLKIEGLSHSFVVAVIIDREGSLWVGTNGGGLNRVKRQAFEVLEFSQGRTVQSVCEDEKGGIWIGYNADKIDYWFSNNLQQINLTLPDPSVLSYVKSVFVDKDGRVLAGTSNLRGPHLFQMQDNRFQPIPHFNFVNWDVFASYQERGPVWVGSQAGLCRWDQRGWLFYTNSGNPTALRALAADREGNLWVGTDGYGLYLLRDEESFTRFTKTNGLPSDTISSLYFDEENVLWVGTPAGLARFHQGKWTRFSKEHGLVSNSIGYILDDGHGYLWIGSNAGLMRVRKLAFKAVADGQENVVHCRAYGEPDGLSSSECTFGSQPGAARLRNGRLLFPLTAGLASLDPTQLQINTNLPPVLIESVTIDDQLQNTNTLGAIPPREVTVPAGTEALDIKFTSLNLAAPDKGRFRFRLEPHEASWRNAPWNIRVAHYTKLPPGDYQFRVQACNEDNIWNEAGSSLAIMVLPPFWRTWWFLSAVTVALLGMIVGTVHYVSTQKLQQQLAGLRQQEALEKERARIARDLHDQLGANLTQVALLGELAETDKNHPEEVEAHARQISQTARETTHALDEIVWTVNPSNDTVDGLINYLCKYAQEYFAIAGLRYRLEVPDSLPTTSISPELRHNVFLAAKEAVNNVVKHAQATSAWLRLRLQPTEFVLEIEDNGKGVSTVDEKTTRNGLRNMRKRMADVGGEFSIGPGTEGGALVRLTVPLRNNKRT